MIYYTILYIVISYSVVEYCMLALRNIGPIETSKGVPYFIEFYFPTFKRYPMEVPRLRNVDNHMMVSCYDI